MRADRLLSLMLLLQTRGRMTAGALAQALEVSERTIYRDVEALSAAGVPIYGEAGPAGGFALLDSYRTTLTGLTEGEVRALFMLSVPAPLTALGVSHDLRSAFLKLAAALPTHRREAEAGARGRIHLDAVWWEQEDDPAPYLRSLYQAVMEDRYLWIKTQPMLSVTLEQRVAPYGLVAKAGAWHLVAASHGKVQVQRVAALMDARLEAETFARPADFDLAAFWQGWCAAQARQRAGYAATVRVAPGLAPYLPMVLGESARARLAAAGPPDADGWRTLTLTFDSLESARGRLLGLGAAVEVVAPLALRLSVADFAAQVAERYRIERKA